MKKLKGVGRSGYLYGTTTLNFQKPKTSRERILQQFLITVNLIAQLH